MQYRHCQQPEQIALRMKTKSAFQVFKRGYWGSWMISRSNKKKERQNTTLNSLYIFFCVCWTARYEPIKSKIQDSTKQICRVYHNPDNRQGILISSSNGRTDKDINYISLGWQTRQHVDFSWRSTTLRTSYFKAPFTAFCNHSLLMSTSSSSRGTTDWEEGFNFRKQWPMFTV